MKNKLVLCLALLMSLVAMSHAQAKVDSIMLKQDQRLTMVLAKNKLGGEQAQKAYLDGVFSLAEKGSIVPLAYFSVLQTLAGKYKPQDFALYAWHNAQASHKVIQHSSYNRKFKPLQSQGWDELAAADIDLSLATSFQFDSSKTYTLAEVWLKDQEQYERYYQGTMELRKQLRAKVVFKYTPNEYSSLTRGTQAPDLLILIEWQNKEDPIKYSQSELFKKHEKYITAGIKKLGWYELAFANNEYTAY